MLEPHWYEDFRVDERFETPSRTVTDADIRAFAEVSGDFNPLHLDDAAAAERGYGGRIAHGVLGLAIATGLVNETGLTRGTLVALLGLEWAFRRPLRPGDTVGVRIRVAGKRETSQADRGVVRMAVSLVDGRQEPVQEGEWTILVRRRASAEP